MRQPKQQDHVHPRYLFKEYAKVASHTCFHGQRGMKRRGRGEEAYFIYMCWLLRSQRVFALLNRECKDDH